LYNSGKHPLHDESDVSEQYWKNKEFATANKAHERCYKVPLTNKITRRNKEIRQLASHAPWLSSPFSAFASLSYSQEKRQQLDKKRPSKCYIPFPNNDPFDWLIAWSYSRPPYILTLSKLISGFLYIEDTNCMSGRKTNYFGAILPASARTPKIRVSGRPHSHASGFRRAPTNQVGYEPEREPLAARPPFSVP
jgi:hypothetical protein